MAGEHVLVTFGGTLGTAPAGDSWQCGVRVTGAGPNGSTPNLDRVGYANAISTPLQTWFTSVTGTYGVMRQDAVLTFIKVASVHLDTPAAPAKPRWKYDVAGNNPQIRTKSSGGPSAGVFPWFLSLAYSWTTANLHGWGHTGRIYPPIAWPGTGASGANLTSAVVADHVTKAKALLTALAQLDGSGTTAVPVVASLKDGSTHQITGVRVGNVIDVQRRRKEQIPETYTAATWP